MQYDLRKKLGRREMVRYLLVSTPINLMKSLVQRLSILCFAFLSQLALGQPVLDNSNLWPIYRDMQFGFHISYPIGWVMVPKRGPNVRFSVNPPSGPGNCNVVTRPNAELVGISQEALKREIESMATDQASWAWYTGLPSARFASLGFAAPPYLMYLRLWVSSKQIW